MFTKVITMVSFYHSALIVCPWGEHGASASGPDGEVSKMLAV